VACPSHEEEHQRGLTEHISLSVAVLPSHAASSNWDPVQPVRLANVKPLANFKPLASFKPLATILSHLL